MTAVRSASARTDMGPAVAADMQCPHCGATVNPVTGEGLHCPDGESEMNAYAAARRLTVAALVHTVLARRLPCRTG